ncbi:MAG: porin [Gammaproteobacteria bacterium]|nr:porin [Gammaproteobacteria bacterium]
MANKVQGIVSNLLKKFCTLFFIYSGSLQAADKQLLDVLLANGAITQEQHDMLTEKETVTSDDIISQAVAGDSVAENTMTQFVVRQIEEQLPVKASQESSGFRLETRDSNWRTDLQWRAQTRFTTPYRSDPRNLEAFNADEQSNFEARRLRMKIGGHGFRPWLRYYFEVDLQPSRDVDDSSSSSSARVIDWRLDIAKWDWGEIRLEQWKVDLNRERVDSSGRQQFVERSIANRVFTVDRQVGIQLRGHLFQDTPADMRYYAGVFNGEGKGVNNSDDNLLYMGRLQWNFLGRDLSWRQTDVEFTEQPTGSLAIAGFTNTGACTRWSSSGCGNLDGFEKPADAAPNQYDINQVVQEFAFKYRGFSTQQEFHRKRIRDRLTGARTELTGGYVQAGYFFHYLLPEIPRRLELAMRYAYVDEPNYGNLALENKREEFTIGANWFFAGHNSKLTLDYSWLDLEDWWINYGTPWQFLADEESDDRLRLQWDVSF